ncbi:MAG: DUF4493 domain-containing protein [Muribaculaceae bacterium]|nr:DUF4493 domain-containing protein [Muribaculaceae bacterium]
MKKNLLAGAVVAMGFALGTVSCGDESSLIEAGTGRISPRITVDGVIITASDEIAGSRANEDVVVTVSDLKLRLTSDDGSFSQEWESINDFDENQEFKVGDYTLEAYYGDENDMEGYGKPHFHGSQDISVHYDRTTDVSMSAAMKNSRVVIKYTDAFKDYMAAYSVRLLTPKGKYVTVPGDEYSPVYVAPGKVSVNLSFTKPNGEGATIEAATFDAKAKTEHVVTIDLNGGQGSGETVLKVSFDSTVESEDVEIDLEDLINAPEPEITLEGCPEDNKPMQVIENTLPSSPVKANIMARGKIAAVTLTTTSPSLKSAGWPEVVDLADQATPQATIDQMTSLGLKMFGIRKNPDVMGVIDFTDVFANLSVSNGLTESSHKFTLQVKDKYGKLSEVAEFTVVSSQGHIEIISATAEIGHKTINAEVEYNGKHELADVTFQMRNNLGTWDELTLTGVQAVSGKQDTYKVNLTSPTIIQSTHTLRAVYGSAHSDIPLEVTTPTFVLHVSDNDVFARRATVTLDCAEADDATVTKSITALVITNHTTGKSRNYDNYKVEDADVIIAGLAPGTLYTVEIQTSNNSASVQFTTETEDHLPGCEDAEDGTHSVGFATKKWSSERVDGNTSSLSWTSVSSSCLQFLWKIEGWGTMNELTTSTHGRGIGSVSVIGGCSYKATSGTIPANSRSTFSDASGGSVWTDKHADGHTQGNASLHNNRQHDGTNAALIRTVGWGNGNKAHSGTSSNAGFGTCENRTQGELYLGTYNNGPQYGYAFTSRPSALTFWYHYDPAEAANGDYGTAEIHVYDADGVEISQCEVLKLTEHANDRWTDTSKRMTYTQATIPITYEKGAKKAASISIIFRSTWPDKDNNPALNSNDTKYWNTPGGNNSSGGEYVGSELYIDDVRLTY